MTTKKTAGKAKSGGNRRKTKTKKTIKVKKNTVSSIAESRTKPKAPRAKRFDSVEAAVAIAQAAVREIKPPENVGLKESDYSFWDSVIAEFAKAEWTDHAKEIAALLARTMADLEKEQRLMRREGSIVETKQVITDEEGEQKVIVLKTRVNPRKQLIAMHCSNILALRRSLSLHARGKVGEARDHEKKAGAAKRLENMLGAAIEDDDDGLIARPRLH